VVTVAYTNACLADDLPTACGLTARNPQREMTPSEFEKHQSDPTRSAATSSSKSIVSAVGGVLSAPVEAQM
jgi:hypothetical protein